MNWIIWPCQRAWTVNTNHRSHSFLCSRKLVSIYRQLLLFPSGFNRTHVIFIMFQMYKSIAETSVKFINMLEDLVALNEKLAKVSEFAVDLEVWLAWLTWCYLVICLLVYCHCNEVLVYLQHHSYRSFLGITCLMQISTREEDFIIDTLQLRSEMYILNETFTDPAIVKVIF